LEGPPKSRFAGSDFVLTSSHLFAHHVKVPQGTPKISYIHTPARYVWEPDLDPRGAGVVARTVSLLLKPLDRIRAKESSVLIANSNFVAERISKHWKLDSKVIHPPVDVDFFAKDTPKSRSFESNSNLVSMSGTYLLGASRFTPQKRLEDVIRAGKWLQLPVVIAGSGPELSNLIKFARSLGVDVEFVISPTRELLKDLYKNAVAFIFPAVEDFGIMPVEALASGIPVIGLNRGGVSETVLDGSTGALVVEFTQHNIQEAFLKIENTSSEECIQQARKFSREVFRHKIQTLVTETVRGVNKN